MSAIELVFASSFYEPIHSLTHRRIAMWIGFVVTFLVFETGGKNALTADQPVTVAIELKQASHREKHQMTFCLQGHGTYEHQSISIEPDLISLCSSG